jgi:hypothetical protein
MCFNIIYYIEKPNSAVVKAPEDSMPLIRTLIVGYGVESGPSAFVSTKNPS